MGSAKRKSPKRAGGHSRPGIMTAIIAAMVAAAVRHSAPIQNIFGGGVSAKQAKTEYLEVINTECKGDPECKSKLMGPYTKCIASLDDKSSTSEIRSGEKCFMHDSTRAIMMYGCDGNSLCVMAISNNFERCYQTASAGVLANTRAEGERMGKSVVDCVTKAAGLSS